MSNAGATAGILATRRDGDVLIADEPTHVEITWPDLPTSDGESLAIRWSASMCCVDSDADRTLLAERYLNGTASTLAAGRVSKDLALAIAPALTKAAAAMAADTVLDSQRDNIAQLIEREARRAAFAVGLAILPPYRMMVTCPSRERAARLAEAGDRLAAVARHDDTRAASLAELTQTIATASDNPLLAQRAIASIRLGDPLDLLRATAIVDPSWSSTSPRLWIAAGTQVAVVDVTRPAISTAQTRSPGDALGPVRSVSPARVDDSDVLLVGARDGVYVVSVEEPIRTLHTLRFDTGSEFGFNAACFLPVERTVVASHSQAGIVAWSLERPETPSVVAIGRARSVIAVGEDRAAILVDGKLTSYARGFEPEPMSGETREIESAMNGRRRRLREEPSDGSDGRYSPAVAAEDEIEVGGVARVVRPLAAGGLEMIDVAGGGMRLPIGPGNLAARWVIARPGFVAAVSVDRTRVLLIDLARPEAVHAELNIVTALGSRVADVCFA